MSDAEDRMVCDLMRFWGQSESWVRNYYRIGQVEE